MIPSSRAVEPAPIEAPAQAERLSLEAVLVARTYLYVLFHKVFGGEPDERLVSMIASRETADVLDEYAEESETLGKLKTFSRGLGRKAADALFMEEIRDEYARFFQGPGDLVALPWESVHVGNETMVFQRSTLEVRRCYERWGMRANRYKSMPDDHVSLMCSFMAMLSHRALVALREGDGEAIRDALASQRSFVHDHLLNWLPAYAKQALRVKKAYLYPQFAQGIEAFVAIDAVFIDRALRWIEDCGVEGLGYCVSAECFAAVEGALEDLCALRLRGIEDNELVCVQR